jgi:hypothetical protein
MAVHYKVAVDCADPHRLAAFWAAALDYVVEDHSPMIRELLTAGTVTEHDVVTIDGVLRWRTAAAVRDPDHPVEERSGVGKGGRVLFQTVPEGKFGELRTSCPWPTPSGDPMWTRSPDACRGACPAHDSAAVLGGIGPRTKSLVRTQTRGQARRSRSRAGPVQHGTHRYQRERHVRRGRRHVVATG